MGKKDALQPMREASEPPGGGPDDMAQDASQVGPRRLHVPLGRPSEAVVGDQGTPGLVTTAGVSEAVAPDTTHGAW